MAIVLGRQSALRVWNGLAAGRSALGCRNVTAGQGSPEDQGSPADQSSPAGQGSPVNQNSPADQGSLAERDALVGRDTFPNQDAAAGPNAHSNRSMPAMFQSSRDYRRRLERDTKAAVKLLESGAAPAFDPSACAHFFGDEAPVHATVAHARLRRARGGIETSVRKGPFHPRSFMQIEDSLYISTPEMAFCEMANVLSLEQLIALGLELCGTYRRTSTFGSAQYDAVPLTSPRALAAFVDQSPQFKGAKKTRRALAHIVAGSASPRESELAMRLRLAPSDYECRDAIAENGGRDGARVVALRFVLARRAPRCGIRQLGVPFGGAPACERLHTTYCARIHGRDEREHNGRASTSRAAVRPGRARYRAYSWQEAAFAGRFSS